MADSAIRALKGAINTADQKRAEIEQEFERHASSIRELQGRHEALKAEKAGFERQLDESRTYQERAERNLKHSQNQKEYEAAMREVDTCQKQIATAETSIAEVEEKIAEVEKELAERAEEIESFEGKRAAAIAEFDRGVAESKAKLEVESKSREEAFATLPAQLASVYNRLVQRSRDGIAVAEVVGGSCSACFMALRPQMQMEVKRGDQIITCESCTRILYVAIEATAA
jgi:predicted  nucleic acid-binding Zn-ribbon protein